MTLYEIGETYEASAIPLRNRLRELRAMLKTAATSEERFYIKRRIAELAPMLTECNKMANFCKRYYERGFYTQDGPLGIRHEKARCGESENLKVVDCSVHLEKRTYTQTRNCGSRVSSKGENVSKSSGRTRRKQIDYLQELL